MTESRTQVPAPVPGRAAVASGAVALAVAMVVTGAAAVGVLYLVMVQTVAGQRLDQAAVLHADADPLLTNDIVEVLNELTIGVGAVVLVACMAVALVRGRIAHAIAAAVLVGGANVTTQALKHGLLTRPDLGYDTMNSLPSGHTTLAASLALALLLVSPRISRGLLVLAGSVAASLVGAGTVVAGWHRPSDVLAALGVCLAWAGLVSLWLLLRSHGMTPSGRSAAGHPAVALAGTVVAVALTYGYGVRPDGAWRDLVVLGVSVAAIGLGTVLCLALAARVMPVDR